INPRAGVGVVNGSIVECEVGDRAVGRPLDAAANGVLDLEVREREVLGIVQGNAGAGRVLDRTTRGVATHARITIAGHGETARRVRQGDSVDRAIGGNVVETEGAADVAQAHGGARRAGHADLTHRLAADARTGEAGVRPGGDVEALERVAGRQRDR